MYIDFKVIGWERINIDKTQQKKVLKALKEGKINSIDDLYNRFGDFCDSEGVSPKTVKEIISDKGKVIIESYNENGKMLFENK